MADLDAGYCWVMIYPSFFGAQMLRKLPPGRGGKCSNSPLLPADLSWAQFSKYALIFHVCCNLQVINTIYN